MIPCRLRYHPAARRQAAASQRLQRPQSDPTAAVKMTQLLCPGTTTPVPLPFFWRICSHESWCSSMSLSNTPAGSLTNFLPPKAKSPSYDCPRGPALLVRQRFLLLAPAFPTAWVLFFAVLRAGSCFQKLSTHPPGTCRPPISMSISRSM